MVPCSWAEASRVQPAPVPSVPIEFGSSSSTMTCLSPSLSRWPRLLPSAQHGLVRLLPSCRPVRLRSSGSSRPRQQSPEWSSCQAATPPSPRQLLVIPRLRDATQRDAQQPQLNPWLHALLYRCLFASLLASLSLKPHIVLSNIAVLDSRQLIQCCVGLTLLLRRNHSANSDPCSPSHDFFDTGPSHQRR